MKKETIMRRLTMTVIPALLFLLNGCRQEIAPKPEDNRFTKIVLAQNLNEPMEMTFLPNGNVLFVERKGGLKMYDQQSQQLGLIASIPVNSKYRNSTGVSEAEEGLMGIVVDPDYEDNHWIYMYYADSAESKDVLARWEFVGDELKVNSKKIILEVPTQREECCHTGGGMTFDREGNLYLTTGNNTSNSNSDGYAPLDERPGMATWDDQRSAVNTNDLRGKILRIHPEPDGSYTIPEGNLFKPGTDKTRPEIYTMGHRNPWRPTIDTKTGFLYWGEVGPDNSEDSDRGPRGYDEFNQAKSAGFFGWPYFIGDNKAYSDYNFETGRVGEKFDPQRPVNNSPNNTGLRELPPAQKAMIWYPYSTSDEFPLVGSAGRSAVGGPVFRKSNFTHSKRPFSSYYEGKWFIVDFMRGNILAVSMDKEGNYKSMEPFLPEENFSSAIDMDFSPEGDLYVLEYGSGWFRDNENSGLIKIEYNAGNRKPKVKIASDRLAGAVPMSVQFSSAGTEDFDHDELSFAWTVSDEKGSPRKFTEANPLVVFDHAGRFTATLKVTDPAGNSASKTLEVLAGNDPPKVDIRLPEGNQTFYYPGRVIAYAVEVVDKEDGSVQGGTIAAGDVAVTFDYLPEGFDHIEASQNQLAADAGGRQHTGLKLINTNDCKSCHMADKKSIGPSYKEVAVKYKGRAGMTDRLAEKVIKGGGGVWGNHAMSAHPQLSVNEARIIVNYILEFASDDAAVKSLPVQGHIPVDTSQVQSNKDRFVLRASYQDRGAGSIHSLSGEKSVFFRSTEIDPADADASRNMLELTTPLKHYNILGKEAYVMFKDIDLTDVREIGVHTQATQRIGATGGTIEIRLDKVDGEVIGEVVIQAEPDHTFEATGQMPQDKEVAKRWREKRRGVEKKLVAIKPQQGKHHIYFVFTSPRAKDQQIQMQVKAFMFHF